MPPARRLIEPFVGAGAVFLATDYDTYLLGDANPDLIAAWVALKQRPREFCERAASFFTSAYHSKEAYLRVRADYNTDVDSFERAVRLPYLNKFSFNGLFRVNKSGQHNVPYGDPQTLPLFPWDNLAAAAEKLARADVLSGGFTGTIERADEGDLVYCDPPYLSSTTGASFSAYTADGFGLAEHQRLLDCCVLASRRGATVLISNHDTPQTRDLYAGLRTEPLTVRRSVGATAQSRTMATELVAFL